MDIATIEAIITRIGLPLAMSAFFLWLVFDIYTLLKSKFVTFLDELSRILTKQANGVESISHAIESFATVLNTVCTNTVAIDAKVDSIAAAALKEILRVKAREETTDNDPDKTV